MTIERARDIEDGEDGMGSVPFHERERRPHGVEDGKGGVGNVGHGDLKSGRESSDIGVALLPGQGIKHEVDQLEWLYSVME